MADDVTTEKEVATAEEVVVTEDVTIETDTVETEEVVVEEDAGEDLLDLSDEAFEKQLEEVEASDDTDVTDESTDEEVIAATTEGASATEEATEEVKTEVVTTVTDTATKEETPGAKPSAVLDKPIEKSAVEAVTAPVAPLEVDDATAVAAYKEIFAPFKANGKTVQVKNKDEAIRLMQMGAGYTRTMMNLKPQLAQVKTLKNNGIDEDELNYLIELKQGNPDAIKKLVRTHGIDPLDIETGEAGEAADAKYRPKDYRASETQVNFEMTVADVGSHPQGRELLESVRNEWDGQSQDAAYHDPNILNVLTEQKTAGIYDQITAQVDHERMLGNLKGVSFLEAYQQVGTIMANNNMFVTPTAAEATSDTVTKTSTQAQPTTNSGAEPEVLDRKAVKPKPKTNNDARAKAVAPVKSGVVTKALPANPMNMSDEDFEKLDGLDHLV